MNLYDVLGVRTGATPAEIRRAFQRASRLLHPALNPGDPASAERFGAVTEAFAVLSDPQRRVEYDRGDAAPVSRPEPEVNFAGFDFSAEVRVGAVDFREIFQGVLRPPRAEESARGEDLEQLAAVSFEESFQGTQRRVQLLRHEQCPACHGEGELILNPRPCPTCEGTGQLRTRRGRMIFTHGCEDCGATGVLGRRPCVRCASEGRVMQSEWLDVQIPAGVGDGSRVRVPGAGNAGRRGGPSGDLLLTVQVSAHPRFRREGDDLFSEVPVTITEAALGAHVEVATPDGPVTIEIPAGTQTGQRFRLRKRGVPKLGERGRGDLYVEARVWVPAVTDDASRELLREFARRHPHDPRRTDAAEGKR